MENKINIAELLKDCPQGMELDCVMYDNLYFNSVNADYYITINCYTLIDGIKTSINFTKYGTFNHHIGAKCVIFPKGKTTWEGFQRPFKEGDIVISALGNIAIISNIIDNKLYNTYCGLYKHHRLITDNIKICIERLATEEEKQKLFDAIKANGYKWNAETKTLEKLVEPIFKVGDRVKEKQSNIIGEIIDVQKNKYNVRIDDKGLYLYFREQDNWELAPNKFDITTLKPFDKVLIRQTNSGKWGIDFFGFHNKEFYYTTSNCAFMQCIPYEGNEHLLGTTNDCDEFYKTW